MPISTDTSMPVPTNGESVPAILSYNTLEETGDAFVAIHPRHAVHDRFVFL
jgi:hypothetical protein